MSKKLLIVVAVIIVQSVMAYLNFNLEMCSLSRDSEGVRHFMSMATACITLIIFSVSFVGGTLFTSVYIHQKAVHYLNSFDGEVTKKYISDNHASKLSSVNGKGHSATKNIWGYLNVGNIVSKKECSNNITINGKVHEY